MDRLNTILIVDDTESNIDMLMAILKNYDVIPALSGEDALEVAFSEEIDLILLDIMMPDIDGYEVCKILKNNPKTKDIPIIFITSKNDEESIEAAYEIGGIDYVTKPFKPRELSARVKTQLEFRKMVKNLDILASRDSLTGAYNRRKFFQKAEETFSIKDDFYVVMIDLDNFKNINDTYGHNIGDVVLKKCVEVINREISEIAFVGRIGGEEFVIIYFEVTKEKILYIVEKIREDFSNIEFDVLNGKKIKSTMSCGIAKKTDDMKNIDELLKIADDYLYIAKNGGKNRVIWSYSF